MLTEVPKNINLELKDGVLTLKAGSKVYVPNGFEKDGVTPKFDIKVIESDISHSFLGTERDLIVFVDTDTMVFAYYNNAKESFSGSSTPTLSTNYGVWYNTTENIIKGTNDKGASWSVRYRSLPILICHQDSSSAITTIDQVFNGFGYIGSTVFALPGVKGLIPNGRNSDGSLKNVEFTTDRVTTIQTNEYVSEFGIKLENNLPIIGQYDKFAYYYDESSNVVTYDGVVRQWMLAGSFVYSSGKITSLTPKKVGEGIVKNKLYNLARRQRSYYKYIDWTQPVLTSDNMSVAEGNIVTTASSHYIDATRPHKVMLGAVSSTTDSNYWQVNNTTSASWLQIKFPYKLRITGLSVYSRPRDNYSGTVTAYTSSSRSVKIGNAINTSAELTKYTFLSGGSGVETDTIYLYVTNQNQWFGLQNLQITAQKVVEGDVSGYDYYKDNLVSYSPIVRGSRTYYKQSEKQRNTGTYTFTLDKDYTAKMLFVGNGGGGGSSQNDSYWRNSSGGSGACFQGKVRLPKGTYTLTIGTLGYGYNISNTANMSGGVDSTDSFLKDSNGKELIRVGCGQRGTVIDVGGNGGTLTLGTLEVLETTKAVNGNKGETNHQYGVGVQKFAKSAYDGTTTGYGAGTSSYYGAGNVYGVAGIFDLVLETDINDYTWYEDVATKIY